MNEIAHRLERMGRRQPALVHALIHALRKGDDRTVWLVWGKKNFFSLVRHRDELAGRMGVD